MTKVTVEMLERVETLIPIYENAADWAGREFPALAPSEHHETAKALRALTTLCRRVIEPGEDVVERCARAMYVQRAKDGGLHPVFAPWASWDDACSIKGWREEQMDAARAVLASLTQGEGD